jgi:hypothetical protein
MTGVDLRRWTDAGSPLSALARHFARHLRERTFGVVVGPFAEQFGSLSGCTGRGTGTAGFLGACQWGNRSIAQSQPMRSCSSRTRSLNRSVTRSW